MYGFRNADLGFGMFRQLTLALAICFPVVALSFDADALARLKETGQCEGCDLSGADLRWAAVFAAELGGADNLVDGILNDANLTGANLYGANLEGTKLRGADLTGANLSWSTMIGADLTGANLTDAKLAGVIFCGTIMPDGVANDSNC